MPVTKANDTTHFKSTINPNYKMQNTNANTVSFSSCCFKAIRSTILRLLINMVAYFTSEVEMA